MKTIFDFRAFLNFLGRNKLYTAINIFGFSISLMFVILLVTYTRQEYAVDQFHSNKERIFRLCNETDACFAPLIGRDLKARCPEIETYVRLFETDEVATAGERHLKAKILLSDPDFFRMFSFRLAEGDTAQVLRSKNGALLSESFARNLFPEGDYLDKTVTIKGESVPVTGILRPFGNSQFVTPDVMLSFEEWAPLVYGWDGVLKRGYASASFPLYLMLKPHADLSAKMPDMLSHLKTYYWPYKDDHARELTIIPLTEVYLSNPLYASEQIRIGSKTLINTFFSVAMLILLFAVINYINLSTAQSESRAREMAVRRLLGYSRKALFTRLIVESVLLCILSLLIALLLAGIAEPIFNRILQTHISVSNLFSASNLGIGVVAIILLGLLTGVIPASVITRARPIDVVRGSFRHKTKMVYNKILIGFQYLITIVLLGCTLTMSRQIDMMLHADLGFDTANKLYLSIPDLNPGQSAGLKNQLLQIAGVENVALVRGVPMLGSNNTSDTWHDRPISIQRFEGDSSYLKIMGFRILRDNRTDDRKAIWLNETAMQAMELPDSASYCEYFKCPIAGIVQDFRYRDLTHPAEPCIIEHMQDNYWPWACIIQLTNLDSPVTLRTIERVYREYTGGMPCEYKTYDEVMHQQYAAQQRMSDILFGFTLVAILISALGILAMATYFIRQRSMEIAVRKVFGSTNREVLQRLVLHFVRYVLAAFVIAVPVIWYLMHDWLSQYVLRIPLSWTIFALAGLTALAIAVATVFGQSWRAANSNPVDAIKR
ncbi:MAG: FtsX-like permease family protein [Alistipes indistinctus]|uniref:FtsX-like permease family protein n=1 Tax=Alistipes indistinctus TaxID=626932 RepID=UPI00241E4DC3|nr:FtsX-like permease family protein [Alistipes indistinctus]MBD9134800.1 FtsX-like permease family protein [Alistipes indistinctus]